MAATLTATPDRAQDGAPALRRRSRPHARTRAARMLAATGVLAVLAVLWFSPLLILLSTAVRTAADFAGNGTLSLPHDLTLRNFPAAWETGRFSTTYVNTMLITVVKTPIGVFISALLAYALAKLELRYRRGVMILVFAGQTVPIYIAIVPLFMMERSLGLTDSLWGLLPPYLAFGLPFTTLVLQQYFRWLPDELFEAARMDGAGDLRIFLQFVIPLSLPVLVTVTVLDMVATRNEMLMALIILSSPGHNTLALGMLNFSGTFSTDYTGLSAGILIAVVPILVIYAFLQRWIVGGLTTGAVKG
ncbi:carbohydrate ABC transporter permease [Streptomyces ochraceiscleroticus]|uniref:Carbohydrate ABC transporter permease n=1 Tax=Streptomyces ochraceiscleroticus TaxID=47761 RepID=A0ABW1MLF0_9ACTN|nr:carbohydrate ABC transporter permease [Streptomyces ochraceiscleroticus]